MMNGIKRKNVAMLGVTLITVMAVGPAHAFNLFEALRENALRLDPTQARPQVQRPSPVGQPSPQQPMRPGMPQPEVNLANLTEKEQIKRVVEEFRNQPPSGEYIRVTQPEWTEEDENTYESFVKRLGRAVAAGKCGTVKNCLRNPEANIFQSTDSPSLIMYSDCADFPYFARAYVAHKLQLPFSHITDESLMVAPVASEANLQQDLDEALRSGRTDNSPYGNFAISRGHQNNAPAPGSNRSIEDYLERMFDDVSTRTFRAGPLNPNQVPLDTYPVRINGQSIIPGTLVHTTGHLYLVYDVDKDGTVRLVDAHPDGSVSAKIVKPSTLDRSRPDQGLGFYRFRNMRLVGAQQMADGELIGGRVVPETDAELIAAGKYSLEQYFGPNSTLLPGDRIDVNAWKQAFSNTDFFSYLAMKLRGQGVTVSADQVVVGLMDSLCTEMKQRVKDVDVAIKSETHLSVHPTSLPENIFSAADETWEQQSSPGRDGRMRAAVGDIARAAIGQWRLSRVPSTGVRFNGDKEAYRKTLRAALANMDNKCQITYTKSDGSRKTLVFSQVLSRLNRLSFDPYHCAEKRWGATGAEMASCRDTDSGQAWYTAQTLMRNYVGKINQSERLVIRSNQPITLDLLTAGGFVDQPNESPINLGYSQAPMMNLDGVLASDRFMQALDSGRY